MKEVAENMIAQLNRKAFNGETHRDHLMQLLKTKPETIMIHESEIKRENLCMLAKGEFLRDPVSDFYKLKGIWAHLQKDLTIPDLKVAGIGLRDLDNRMGAIHWSGLKQNEMIQFFSDQQLPLDRKIPMVAVLADLFSLGEYNDQIGMAVRDQLIYKYLVKTPFEKHYDTADIVKKFSVEQSFHLAPLPTLNWIFKSLQTHLDQAQPKLIIDQKRKKAPPGDHRGKRLG